MDSSLDPLQLEEVVRATEGVSQEQAQLIRRLYGLAIVNERDVRAMEELQRPWLAVARMSERQFDPKELWRKAAASRSAFRRARHEIHVSAGVTGNWPEYYNHQKRMARVAVALLSLYAAAALHYVHVVGIINHSRHIAVLDAFCFKSPPTPQPA